MRLKSLELVGFKSFVDKTKLIFEPGVTAVVGPNGCGKSNIVDAILWTMGEQSAKSLRGDAMEDVIFNGTESREPVGFAEANLTFDNTVGAAPPQYDQFSEITITRRLSRTGESEYLINKVPCRLKDIQELFMDTGAGTKAYSIIKQGQIEWIVNSKPDERRILLEEAAGIAKYKSRRRAAERKLKATQENLIRIEDILREITRQLNSLDRQARKSERYKKYKEEMRSLDLTINSRAYVSKTSELKSVEEKYSDFKDQRLKLVSEIESMEAKREELKANALDMEKLSDQLKDRLFTLQSEVTEREAAYEMTEKESESLKGNIEAIKSEIGELKAHANIVAGDMERMDGATSGLSIELESAKADIVVKERLIQLASDNIEQASIEHREAREKLQQTSERLAEARQSLEIKTERLKELEQLVEEKRTQHEAMKSELEQLKQTSFDFTRNLDDLKTVKEDMERRLNEETGKLEELNFNYSEKLDRLTSLNADLNRMTSRFESLKEMENNYDGYQRGVQAIMTSKADGENIRGLVVDIFETDKKYETALEAVLGERLQYIIVKSQESGVEAIDYLKACSYGRSSFVPIALKDGPSRAPLRDMTEPGVIGPILEHVSVGPEYSKIASHLLGDVVIVDDLTRAIGIMSANGHEQTLVTLDGEVVDPYGIVTGGSGDSYGILAKKREIRELSDELVGVKKNVDEVRAEVDILKVKVGDTQQAIDGGKVDQHRHEMEILHHQKELERFDHESTRLHNEIKDMDSRINGLSREAGNCEQEISRLKDETADLGEKRAHYSEEAAKKETIIHNLRTEIESLVALVTDLKVQATSLKERLEAGAQRLEAFVARKKELEEKADSKAEDLERCVEGIKARASKTDELKTSIEALHKTRSQNEIEVQEAREGYQNLGEEVAKIEGGLNEKRKASEGLGDTINQANLKVNEISFSLEHMASTIDERYAVDLAEVAESAADAEGEEDVMRSRLAELKGYIERMGEVNLTAIAEYTELKNRADFLSNQHEDLTTSIEDLKKVITKINRTSRERFKKAFEEISARFEEVFPKMFGGGRAKLLLVGDEDVLEAGVDISAQPPGKKLQNMTLLSGGEKAMTAVALIIALFLVKPSPFCMLDEVDSPLDDENVDRFAEIIKELSKKSQFVVITHNKRTMQTADTLHGITMEEQGISKLVSVRLSDKNASEAA